ncbi:MAG: glycogen synthase GlgA [Acidiferrobacteraceae bacterium]
MTGTSGAPRVLYAATECAPWVKTGGLGDVVGTLPEAIRAAGVDLRVLLPAYPALRVAIRGRRLATFEGAVLSETTLPSGVPALLLEASALFDRDGGPYQDRQGRDWPDNAERFSLFARAAAWIAGEETSLGWRPQLLHCNDWQTALAPAYLRFMHGSDAVSLMTVHNLAFQGLFSRDVFQSLRLPEAAYAIEGIEFYGKVSFLKAGLYYADAISTVSPTYAREIQRAPTGFGLEGLLAKRHDVLHGILNGIDVRLWDPARDPLIAAPYDCDQLETKARNKRALQEFLGLYPDPHVPLFGTVSRLTHQKGIDLLLSVGERLVSLPGELALLGRGDKDLEEATLAFAQKHRGSAATIIGFDEGLAHLIEAGADIFLMPSRFEPCGLNQMYSQRYGTPPVAHATGGLVDTITDFDPRGGRTDGSGFMFAEPTPASFFSAIQRAVAAYRDTVTWRRLQKNGMHADFSWDASAQHHAALYRSLIDDRERSRQRST